MMKTKKGQSTLEYALIITVVIAALLAINVYMKHGVQGRLKESADDIGKQFDAGGNYSSSWKTLSTGQSNTTEVRDTTNGTITSTIVSGENITRSEYETFGNATVTQHQF